MNKKPTIYLQSTLQSLINEIGSAHHNRVSTVINAVAERYAVIIRQSTPHLKEREWALLREILSGYHAKNVEMAASGLFLTVQSTINSMPDREIYFSLSNKIHEMSFAERMAVIHKCECHMQ